MAPEVGVERLPWLFTGTFLFTLVTVPGFGWVAKHVRRSWLIPSGVQRPHHEPAGFLCPFAVHIVLLEAAAFFIWLSVFNLLIIPLS